MGNKQLATDSKGLTGSDTDKLGSSDKIILDRTAISKHQHSGGMSEKEKEMIRIRNTIDKHQACLYPYVSSSLDRWSQHTSETYALFGHERYSSSFSVKTVTEMNKE